MTGDTCNSAFVGIFYALNHTSLDEIPDKNCATFTSADNMGIRVR